MIMKYKIDINQKMAQAVSKKWVQKIAEKALKKIGVKSAEISIAFVGDREMKNLNHQYRGKNKTTDVLSFLYDAPKRGLPLKGEIIISGNEAARQAKESDCTIKEEIKLLLVHGILHLCGYDHEKSLREAKKMEKLQNKLVKLLN